MAQKAGNSACLKWNPDTPARKEPTSRLQQNPLLFYAKSELIKEIIPREGGSETVPDTVFFSSTGGCAIVNGESSTMETTKTLCPFCKSQLVTQVLPASLLDKLAALISVHPFQCESCKRRFRIKQQGGQSSSDSTQRRKSLRVSVQIPVTFESNEVSGEGTLTDISQHGCSLVSKQTLRPGIVLRLHLPADKGQKPDSTAQQLASVLGVNGSRAGLKFLAYSPQERDALTQTVTRSMKIFAS